MNLIIGVLIVVLNSQLITGAYKKRRNEHCSLLVNGICYEDELNGKPLKIVHDEHGMKSVSGSGKTKKSRKKISTDVIQSKSWEQKLPKFKELFGNAAKLKYSQPSKSNGSQRLDQQRLDQQRLDQRPKLIFKYHKLAESVNRSPTPIFTNLPRSILDTSTVVPAYSQLPTTLARPTVRSSIVPTSHPHLSSFKVINRPLLGSGSFQRYSYPLASPFLNSLALRLPDHYSDTSLLTDESPLVHRKTVRLVSNYQLRNLPSSKQSTPDNRPSTTSTTSSSSNYWLPNFFTTPSAIVPALPTNLTNYINLRERNRLFTNNDSYGSDANNYYYNTTQDRVWTDDDSSEQMPTKASPFENFKTNKTKSDPFRFMSSIESDDLRSKDLLTTTDLSSSPFSTEESSKEISDFKLANQLDANGFRSLENSNEKDRNQQLSYLDKDTADKFGSLDSKEFANEKFESVQPLSNQPHEWPASIDAHQIDDLLANGKPKNDLKSAIDYLTDDEQKANLLANNHNGLLHPVFYPVKHPNKPTYTIIQLKDKNFQNLDKWKQTMKTASKLIKKVAIEEAKKFKKNELDTFLKRKKLIIDRYKPNDYYQKALAAKYVWKKVSLDFLSLLGYQIANYLGPLNTKHWIKHSDLIDRHPDQLKALEHILKSQHYQNDPYLNKYLLNGGQLTGEHTGEQAGLVGDEFHSVHGGLEHLSSPAADQFLNDDTFFNQNYFKLKENDESTFLGGQHENKLTMTSEDPLMASSLTSEVDQSSLKVPFDQTIKVPPFQPAPAIPPALTEKEKELDKQFFTNQLLNQKLLNQHLDNDNTIDFRTKEHLQQMIKPIKITQQND